MRFKAATDFVKTLSKSSFISVAFCYIMCSIQAKVKQTNFIDKSEK